MSAEEDAVIESPFQQYIQLANVPVVDVPFPTSERWQDVARCQRVALCGGSGAHEMKGLRSFSSAAKAVYISSVREEMLSRETGERENLKSGALSLMARFYTCWQEWSNEAKPRCGRAR